MRQSPIALVKPVAGRSPHRLIMREGVCVGELEVDRFWRRSRESVVEEFGASPSEVFPLFDRLGVPDVLNVTWVFDLRVPAALRGQGIAREALACLFNKAPGLILLQLGPATSARMSQEKRREVYRRLGFSLFRANGMELAMRWDDPRSLVMSKKSQSEPRRWARPQR